MTEASNPPADDRFRRRVVLAITLAIALVAFGLLAWQLQTLVLMTFLAVLLAVLLTHMATFVHEHAGIPQRWAVVTVALALVAVIAGAGLLLAPTLTEQVPALVQQLPKAANAMKERLGSHPWLDKVWQDFSQNVSLPDPGVAFGQAGRVLGGVTSLFAYLGLVIGGAVFLALEPELYRRGFVRLVPVRHRDFADDILRELETTIVQWLGGQFVLMAFIGVLVGLGLWFLGVPYALALGLLAGLLEFIPYLGPILAAIPAVLLALTQGPLAALWTALLIFGVQELENNILQPLIQRSAVKIPPVVLLVVLFGMGEVFGVAGLIVATPMLAVILVLVKRIYVERILESGRQPFPAVAHGHV